MGNKGGLASWKNTLMKWTHLVSVIVTNGLINKTVTLAKIAVKFFVKNAFKNLGDYVHLVKIIGNKWGIDMENLSDILFIIAFLIFVLISFFESQINSKKFKKIESEFRNREYLTLKLQNENEKEFEQIHRKIDKMRFRK